MRSIFATIALAASCSAVAAEPNMTGNQLFEVCNSEGDMAQQGFCIGYVVGALEGMTLGVALPFMDGQANTSEINLIVEALTGFCLPEGPTYGQYRDIVVNYLARNPQTRHYSARMLIHFALRETFTCQPG